MHLNIQTFKIEFTDKLILFFNNVFTENNRILDLNNKDNDLLQIENSYKKIGNFWCLIDEDNNIVGTIALRKKESFFEIRRFFILKKYTHKGFGKKLLEVLIDYAYSIGVKELKVGTMKNCYEAIHLFEKYKFCLTKKYSNSSAEIFYRLTLDFNYMYYFFTKKLNNSFSYSLILNPTENIPMYCNDIQLDHLEGLYISERFKDLNDKVIFGGRNDYIKFFEIIKKEWSKKLQAFDIDLKTLSGLNAHLILFLCILKKGETVMLLPEICGGHFATSKILENLNCNIIYMIPDLENFCVDIKKTKEVIEKDRPNYIFVDRSEGLIYEDFSWLKSYNDIYKIFDASQYFSQILTGYYQTPFEMGFDMIITTLHKNYPGPQKGLIAVKAPSKIWELYQNNAKTYISNTHPMSIAKSIMPLLYEEKFNEYSNECILIHSKFQELLIDKGLPVIKCSLNDLQTLHIWILCKTKEESYNYYLKLEKINILTNYRLLPYNLGYGLRIGVNAAVRMGLNFKHLEELTDIMAYVYKNNIDSKIIKKAKRLINNIISIVK